MKKIRFFINTLEAGGAEKVLVNLINVLSPKKYNVTLLTISGGEFVKDLPSWIYYKQIINNNQILLAKFFKKVIYHLPRVIFNFFFLRGNFDYEIAFMHGFPTKIMYLKTKSNSKVYAFIHGDFSAKFSVNSLYKDEQECLREYEKFDKVCFVSQMALDGFEARVGHLNNAMVIHNIIDSANIIKKSNIQTNIKFQTGGLKIITVGRLNAVKGFDRLIRISKELEVFFDFEIIIAGEGEEKIKLEQLIKSLNVHTVKLVGFQSNPYSIMKQADLYVCSSFQEAYSTSVAEAIVLGLPVLTTNCAGMDEILEKNKYGIICENSEITLLKELKSILNNRNLLEKYRNNIKKYQLLNKELNLGDYSKILIED